MENQNPTQGQVPQAPTGTTKPADVPNPPPDDKHIIAAIAEAMTAVDAYIAKWAETRTSRPTLNDPQTEEYTRLYNEAAVLFNRASGLTWAAFKMDPDTLRGMLFKVEFGRYLDREVEQDAIEGWPHYDEWPGEVLSWDLGNLGAGYVRLPEDLGSAGQDAQGADTKPATPEGMSTPHPNAVRLAAVPVSTASNADASLVAAWGEFKRLIEEANGEVDEVLDRKIEEAYTHFGKLITIPSNGFTGILMKLRAAWRDVGWVEEGEPIKDLPVIEQLVHSALQDAERLAGVTASAPLNVGVDDPVAALGNELRHAETALDAAWTERDNAEAERFYDPVEGYPPAPAVYAGRHHCMSEIAIREHCQPEDSDGPDEHARDRLIAEFQGLQAAYQEAREKAGLAEVDRAAEECRERWRSVMDTIATTPATSIEGVTVKVGLLVKAVETGDTGHEGDISRGALADIERIAMGVRREPQSPPRLETQRVESEAEASGLPTVPHGPTPDGDPIDALEMTYLSVLSRLIQHGKAPTGEAREPFSRFLLFDTGEMKPGWAEFIARFREAEDRVFAAMDEQRRATDEHGHAEPAEGRDTATSIMDQGQRLAELWDEVTRIENDNRGEGLLEAVEEEAHAIEKRIAAMRATSPEEALIQLRQAAGYFDHECNPDLWDVTHLLVWSATWALNGEFGQRIPFADKYSPPRMDPAFVETKRRAALDRQAGGGAS